VTVFGAGGGTSSYNEIEDADLIVFWGSNAREAHPIFFHHALKAIHKGAKVYAVDPRRSKTAEWADSWLGLDVGTDVALAYGVGREIIHAGLVNEAFVANASVGFEDYVAACEPWTLEVTSRETGVPAELIRQLAHDYAKAERAQLCWTLGITEHHNGTDNVRALCNLALLTGQVGRWGAGLVPVRGQNNVQGGGDMGAIPKNLPGFQDVGNPEHRAKFERMWGVTMPPKYGLTLSEMMEAMDEGHLTSVYVVGENPVQSDADTTAVARRLQNLDHLVVQDIFLTKTASFADVVLPSTAAWCESEGTFTNSERRVQLVRKALEPPGSAKDDIEIIRLIAERLGHVWPIQTAEQIWDELRAVSPAHHGMSYRILEERGGVQWPFPDENGPESPFLHGRLWEKDPAKRGRLAPFGIIEHRLPVDKLNDEFPLRLTTGRRLTRRSALAPASISRRRIWFGSASMRARWSGYLRAAEPYWQPRVAIPACAPGYSSWPATSLTKWTSTRSLSRRTTPFPKLRSSRRRRSRWRRPTRNCRKRAPLPRPSIAIARTKSLRPRMRKDELWT